MVRGVGAPLDEPHRSLLIVDDHDRARDGLAELLRETAPPLDIAAVADAESAFRRCRSEPPDVVLLDFRLPGSDGASVIRELRHIAPSSQVVVLTGDPNPTVVAAATDAGAAACVGKAGDIDALLQTIRQVAGWD